MGFPLTDKEMQTIYYENHERSLNQPQKTKKTKKTKQNKKKA